MNDHTALSLPLAGKRILMMAGGTGGHIFPALTLAEALGKQGATVYWLGSEKGLETTLVPQTIPQTHVRVQAWRGRAWWQQCLMPLRLLPTLLEVWRVFRRVKPDLSIGMGGFTAGPGGLMSYFCSVPLVIHEQNAVAGLTNRWLAPFAKKILTGFPEAFGRSNAANMAIVTGNPVREKLLAVREQRQQRPFALGKKPLKILILGGSRGALALNDTVPRALALLSPAERPCIWHQTGEKLYADTQALYDKLGLLSEQVTVEAFINDMEAAYLWADLVVCRAGALTVAELLAVGLPSILVPYPFAVDDHQTKNAVSLAALGAAILLTQSELTPERLLAEWEGLTQHPDHRKAMTENLYQLLPPNATQEILKHCEELLHV